MKGRADKRAFNSWSGVSVFSRCNSKHCRAKISRQIAPIFRGVSLFAKALCEGQIIGVQIRQAVFFFLPFLNDSMTNHFVERRWPWGRDLTSGHKFSEITFHYRLHLRSEYKCYLGSGLLGVVVSLGLLIFFTTRKVIIVRIEINKRKALADTVNVLITTVVILRRAYYYCNEYSKTFQWLSRTEVQ